jgi:hypothetical protein
MKKIIFILLVSLSLTVFSQESTSKFDFRLGVGSTFLGSGDMLTIAYENELNYHINNYLTASPSIGFAKSNYGVNEIANYMQGNVNLFYSPFKNNKTNDFRIGLGASFLNYSYSFEFERQTLSNGKDYSRYLFPTENDFGLNVALENTFKLSPRLLLGVKAFTQIYTQNINSGLMVKVGYSL